MDIKLIATDVDGTLVGADHMVIPKVNIEAMNMAKEKGIINVISTGRSLSLAAGEIEKLGCIDYAVISTFPLKPAVITISVTFSKSLYKSSIHSSGV